jgi:alpha-amylase/alpha-mannosidase (GH57 family)
MVDLLLLWHMHQPRYADPTTGVPILPWVRVHACSGYLDMARLLERFPLVHATVNFVPSLVEQIEALLAGTRDALELLTERPVDTLSGVERESVIARSFSVHASAVQSRARFLELENKRHAARLDDADVRDLECLFLLGWVGFSARREDQVFSDMDAKGRDFTEDDKRALHEAVRRAAQKVLPAWRALQERGQIELSASPFHHPILPLLIDTDVAHRSRPEDWLPPRFTAADDARLQIERGIESHTRWTGQRPRGMWPPEGSLSPEAVRLYGEAGLRWLGGDDETLARSLGPDRPPNAHTRIYQRDNVSLLFRDRDLSDRIGFRYAHMSADHAVHDLLAGARHLAGEDGVVNVFLDGENAWENYPGRGEPFLQTLYAELERQTQAGTMRTCTVSEVLVARGRGAPLANLHSGSWIASSFRIWIGDPVKNRAWELLRNLRERLRVVERERGSADAGVARARELVLAAQASDWMWWFGEPNHCAEDALYDELFRGELAAAYRALGDEPPPELRVPIDPRVGANGAVTPAMRMGHG